MGIRRRNHDRGEPSRGRGKGRHIMSHEFVQLLIGGFVCVTMKPNLQLEGCAEIGWMHCSREGLPDCAWCGIQGSIRILEGKEHVSNMSFANSVLRLLSCCRKH